MKHRFLKNFPAEKGMKARSQKPEWKVIIDLLRETTPVLYSRFGRKMIHFLLKKNVSSVAGLIQKLDVRAKDSPSYPVQEATQGKPPNDLSVSEAPVENMSHHSESFLEDRAKAKGQIAGLGENQPMPRLNSSVLEKITEEIFEIAAQELSENEILRVLRLWVKQEQFRFFSRAAERRDIPLAEITDAVNRFEAIPDNVKSLSKEERIGIRVALIRRLFTEDLAYINSVKNKLRISDFAQILNRCIGPSKGNGKLGGKAAGLFRAEKIIDAAKGNSPGLKNVRVPKTWYITSDGLLDFMYHNALEEMPTIKYRQPSEIKQEYGYLGQIFKNSSLSPEIISGLSMALNDFGDKPLIVRSSSLLEDSPGSAFAGKYKSLFVPNKGGKKERLQALEDAIVEVYASTFGPDPIEYRRERGLLDFNEEMAIMIQEVVGQKAGKYFFPAFAGVAFSCNEFRWSPRIRRDDGIIRLVTGLGTRAVDRIDRDFPMLVCPGQPGLRANVTLDQIMRYSQTSIDVINLETGGFETHSIEELIKEVGREFPQVSQIVSMCKDGQLYSPVGIMANLADGFPVINFANLLNYSPFVSQIKALLDELKNSLGWPVDIEFAAGEDPESVYLLQCRPQCQFDNKQAITFPQGIPVADQLFTANRYITSCQVRQIEYLVYVDPFEYDNLSTYEEMEKIGLAVGELNAILPPRKFILLGPGRWGSRGDIKLGVKVAYSDINNTAMLIEIARTKMGYTPDLSFGTHFFQDLVEAEIRYLPLYPDEQGNLFNEAFFKDSPNALKEVLPTYVKFEKTLRVLRISDIFPQSTVSVVMDGESDRAISFIERKQQEL